LILSRFLCLIVTWDSQFADWEGGGFLECLLGFWECLLGFSIDKWAFLIAYWAFFQIFLGFWALIAHWDLLSIFWLTGFGWHCLLGFLSKFGACLLFFFHWFTWVFSLLLTGILTNIFADWVFRQSFKPSEQVKNIKTVW
jgi:hypothetical protein